MRTNNRLRGPSCREKGRRALRLGRVLLAVVGALACAPPALCLEVTSYARMCDASAAVAMGPKHFVVADDERNVLRIYRRGQPQPVRSIPLSAFLDTEEEKESDLEGAAVRGSRIFWISSHGRSSQGKLQQRRYRFFATRVERGSPPRLIPIGKPYTELLSDLIAADEKWGYGLVEASRLPPEAAGGLNIEGLAATPEGTLLIGFRNPIPGGRALIVPLQNPEQLIDGGRARFGTPIELDLGGRGVRSIERIGPDYLVVAGPPADAGTFALYRWSGRAGEAARMLPSTDLEGLRPEALFAVPRTGLVQILSDDGGVESEGIACKDRPESAQSFRSILFEHGVGMPPDSPPR